MWNLDKKKILVVDTETNALRKPNKIHIVCTRTGEGETNEFRNVTEVKDVQRDLVAYLARFETFVGHNFIQYDLLEVLDRLVPDHPIRPEQVIDTLVVSRLINYGRTGGHSLAKLGESYGVEKKGKDIEVWDELTEEMVERCHSDTAINLRELESKLRFLSDEAWHPALRLEHSIARVCGEMSQNGFPFDYRGAEKLYGEIAAILQPIDEGLSAAFPPRVKAIREITPRVTKAGTFNLNDFRWYDGDDLTIFTGGPFTLVEYIPFNPGSPKQIVERLNEAGWKPTDKTKGHIDALKDKKTSKEKLAEFKEFGWKVNEENLKTLPDDAPEAARDLAKRIVLQSRLADIAEWQALAEADGRGGYIVHGQFNPIGAWTHRLSHSKPNLANVPVAKRSKKDTEFECLVNDFNDRMRQLWTARPGYRLIGTDADGLQMRIFAHYVEDEELINALIRGRKEDKTDIHSLHQRKLGEDCRSRDDAKTFIYAWLLGAGIAKVAEILQCSIEAARRAVDNFIASYPKLQDLKRKQIPADARRGYFVGLDGRKVICDSEHLMLAGYLQNGEAIIMKGACLEWQDELRKRGIQFWMRTWPHDEWQTEIRDDQALAEEVSRIQIQAIRNQAVHLNMKCPLEGTTSIQFDHPPYPDGFVGGYTWKDTH